MKWALGVSPNCDVVIQDQMLSTAQQMLQDSRSKIELIRLQIIKVTQAGGGGGGEGGDGGSISSDGHQDSFTHGGQSPSRHLSEGHCTSTHSGLVFSQVLCWWYYRPLSFSLVRNLDNELCLIIHQVVTAATFLYIFHCCSVWHCVIFLVFHAVTAAWRRVGSWSMIRKPEVKNHVWKKICISDPFLPHPNVKLPRYDFTMKMVGVEIRLKGEASSFITLDIYHYYLSEYTYNSNKSRAPRNILYLPDFKWPLKNATNYFKEFFRQKTLAVIWRHETEKTC